ncbi:MAG: hypothetical protein H5T66_13990 [Chloroflexi bacterium]|nr:hypothetical protein [Chloroflexota bacterium]
MDWMAKVREVLRLDEEELSLWREIAAEEPNPGVRALIKVMLDREKEEMEDLRALLRYDPYAEKAE